MLAKKACVPSIYHQPKVAIEELRPFLKKLCSYEFIDDEEFNGKAIQFLELYEKTLEPELLWRLARACVERSRFTIVNGRKISPEEKVYFIKKAFELGREALKQAKESSSGAHKWYAITLITLMKEYAPSDQLSCFNNSKKFRKTLAPTDGDVQAEIRAHLERAVELDPKDHYAWYILGTQYRAIKDQEKASKCFEKAGDIQVAI
uniref:Regulator of microtubule dynamics protein 1 n=1 Tax=Acrobeloides nanus TaxID=290746 RepID=A0A914C9C6_9BILA